MAAETLSIALTRTIATTREKTRNETVFDIVTADPFMTAMLDRGAYELTTGEICRQPVVLTESANVRSVGLYEKHTAAAEDSPQNAVYAHWGKTWAGMVLDKSEVLRNKGPLEIVNLVQTQRTRQRTSMKNELSRQLLADGSASSSDMKGLAHFLLDVANGSQTGTVGNLDRATYSNWQNQRSVISAFGADGIDAMEECFDNCSDSGSIPDLILCGGDVYRFFKKTQAPSQMESDPRMRDYGFQALKFNGATIVPHPLLTSGEIYMLTTSGSSQPVNRRNLTPKDFAGPSELQAAVPGNKSAGFCLSIQRGTFFRESSFDGLPDGDQLVSNLYFEALLGCSSLKRQGRVGWSGAVAF